MTDESVLAHGAPHKLDDSWCSRDVIIPSCILQFASGLFLLVFSPDTLGGSILRAVAVPFFFAKAALWIGVGLATFLYLFDVSYWSEHHATLQRVSAGLLGSCFVLFALLSTAHNPALPVATLLLSLPFLAVALQRLYLHERSISEAMAIFSANFAVSSGVAGFTWLSWLAYRWRTHDWDGDRDTDELTAQCRKAAAEDFESTRTCLQGAWVLWASGGILSVSACLFSVVCSLLSHSTARPPQWAASRLSAGAPSSLSLQRFRRVGSVVASIVTEREAHKTAIAASAAKLLVAALSLVLLGMYLAAKIQGAGPQIARAMIAFCGVALVAIIGLVGVEVGWSTLGRSIAHNKLLQLLRGYAESDMGHAGAVFAGAPLFVLYLASAVVNQSVRRLMLACGVVLGPVGSGGALTPLAESQLRAVATWPWAPILRSLALLALVAWVLLFGSTLTYLALALLIQWLQHMHWLVSSLLFLLVGLVMFALPPVPGLAVYLCAGVLLTPAAEAAFGGPLGFWWACAYSSLLSYLIKLLAQVVQQKLIGEALGGSLRVKLAVGVNSDLIKAIRHILEQPGLSLAKVSVLCGGPDWPTAVLCGILRLELSQMLAGLSPIFLLTVPCSLAGAFQLKAPEGELYASLGTVMLLLAALVQLVSGSIALYYIEEVKSHEPEALARYADDAEVATAERQAEARRAAFVAACGLRGMELLPKAMLLSGATVLTLSAYLLIGFGSRCFTDFALTDDLEGDERPLVKPLGRVALALLVYGGAAMAIFDRWAERAVDRRLERTALV